MKTYQDLIAVGDNERSRMEFVASVVSDHKQSKVYREAVKAERYYLQENPTIMQAQKIIYDVLGLAHRDNYAANNKIPSSFFFYFVTQLTQYLLGNGVSFAGDKTKDALGGVKFDLALQDMATNAQKGGVSFGFWNLDHVDVFSVAEFAPLYDEETSALKAGVRWWQIDPTKPMRYTLYELDGYTEYIHRTGEDITILQEKRPYILNVNTSEAAGTEIVGGANYPTFPIVPLYNINKVSALHGKQSTLDAYDLMASALVNNVDDGNLIYWVIRNAGGMDDMDDQRFVDRLKTLHTVHLEGNEEVDAHQIDAPFEANEAALELLRNQLFDDFMAFDPNTIASGAVTATQIKAAYEKLSAKAALFERSVTAFVLGVLELAGIEDAPDYTPLMIVNQSETITTLVQAAEFLSSEYITRKVLDIFGDTDQFADVMEQIADADLNRFSGDLSGENSEAE